MALKDILVHVDDTEDCALRIETAIGLARVHGAHLIGVSLVPDPAVPEYAVARIGRDIFEQQRQRAYEEAKVAENLFIERTKGAGVAVETICGVGDVTDLLCRYARYADMAVVGQCDEDAIRSEWMVDLPEQMALVSGRPVLVVPYAGSFPTVGKRVMVAWNRSAMAARAVNDALPILEKAEKVIVMVVNPADVETEVPGANICRHLARHGITAEAQDTVAPDIDVGDVLLSRAADESIDLLVMGAYGHARWRELVLGGVTRLVLSEMTIPVLMSH